MPPNVVEEGEDKPASVSALHRLCYAVGTIIVRPIVWVCIREKILGAEHLAEAEKHSAYILAPTHISHLEPILLSCKNRRQITWLARQEFYAFAPLGFMLRALGALSINRFGAPVRTLRRAIALLRSGHTVGIFPEGGVQKGPNTIFRNGVNKQGACLLSLRTGTPILPVILLGTHRMNAVIPWLPLKLTPLTIAYCPPIYPPATPTRAKQRAARHALARRLQDQYVASYAQLLATTDHRDIDVP